jgi:hypothetical protein
MLTAWHTPESSYCVGPTALESFNLHCGVRGEGTYHERNGQPRTRRRLGYEAAATAVIRNMEIMDTVFP